MSMTAPIASGDWYAELETPTGPLRFGLHFSDAGAWLVNGSERIDVPRVTYHLDTLGLHIDHYDSRIEAMLSDGGRRLAGTWTKRRGQTATASMEFAAVHASVAPDSPWVAPSAQVAEHLSDHFSGRFAVEFAGDADPAVGVFEVADDGTASGTFLTSTGDYRYLSGGVTAEGQLELSVFDGAHAFLFQAPPESFLQDADAPQADVRAHFWSGNWYEDTWVARRDPGASVPDALTGTRLLGQADVPLDLGAFRFPDLDGHLRSLDDPAFAGRARLIQLFGSWCPNCADACDYLAELHEAYGDRGLSIVGLAFEITGDFERDAVQVRRYAERHGVTWPLLVAGLSDKAEASKVLPFLDRVRSYPTTIFLSGDGRVAAVWQGFSGPATGEAHLELRRTFEGLIEDLLASAPESASVGSVGG